MEIWNLEFMKICPVCRTTYDEFQNFCLNDGTPLVNAATEPQQVQPLEPDTVVQPNEPSTVVNPPAPTNVSGRQTNYGQTNLPQQPPIIVEKSSGTGKIVALTALVTLLFAVLIGGGAYLVWLNRNRQTAQVNVNQNSAKPKNTNSSTVSNSSNANLPNLNANTNANVAPSPSPVPTLSNTQANQIRKDVNAAIDGWKASTEDRDLNTHVGFYAPTVDYYNGGRVPADKVRSDRQQAFDTYPNIEIEISNVKITPEPSGDKATAIIDKAWRFENEEKVVEGKVQQQLMLEKLGNRWYISGEKDLKVYYKSNY